MAPTAALALPAGRWSSPAGDLLNKQSFLNQWLLVAQLVLAALALSAIRPTPPDQPPTRQTDHVPLGRLTTNPSAD